MNGKYIFHYSNLQHNEKLNGKKEKFQRKNKNLNKYHFVAEFGNVLCINKYIHPSLSLL